MCCLKLPTFVSPVDGIWKNWVEWGACTLTCGGGKQHRSRECTPPEYNGNDCVGPPDEEENCNEQPCPSKRASMKVRERGVGESRDMG